MAICCIVISNALLQGDLICYQAGFKPIWPISSNRPPP